MRRPGIEPGSTAWKATMLTITPPTLLSLSKKHIQILSAQQHTIVSHKGPCELLGNYFSLKIINPDSKYIAIHLASCTNLNVYIVDSVLVSLKFELAGTYKSFPTCEERNF